MIGVWSITNRDKTFNQSFMLQILYMELSVSLAKRFFNKTVIYMDENTSDLVSGKLIFSSDHLEILPSTPLLHSDCWVYGKLLTYSLQERPFLHIDNDVFFFKDCLLDLIKADIITQSVENVRNIEGFVFSPHIYVKMFDYLGGKVPSNWRRYASLAGEAMENMGVFGGNRIDLIQRYTQEAFDLLSSKRNFDLWTSFGCLAQDSILIEQYTLSACISNWKEENVSIGRIFNYDENPYDSSTAHRKGYTHLIADSKRQLSNIQKVCNILGRTNPSFLAQWLKLYQQHNPIFYLQLTGGQRNE